MEVILKLTSQQKVTGLAELLLVAAKSSNVSEEGMKMALSIIDDLKAAVAAVNAARPGTDPNAPGNSNPGLPYDNTTVPQS